jgi:ankyrin repeat protein
LTALTLASEAKNHDVVKLLAVFPLIWDARDGQQKVVKSLLIAGADVNHSDHVSLH